VRVVLQRVSRAAVSVNEAVIAAIDRGFLVLAGFGPTDDEATLSWMADKIAGLRLFGDEHGKMNLDLSDVGGGVLVVSQFTLYGDVAGGRRPSFVAAAPGEQARALYERFVTLLAERVAIVAAGEFGAMMAVELVNDGPVTLVLER
jgi:D-tyrosyl-tRNA(Tyr) deacylase